MTADRSTVRRPHGPVEEHEFPSELSARVITPGANPRLHGFSVEGDLAQHYRFPELVLVALTGEAPDETHGRAFDIALQFLAPLAVNEAPTHAAVLARLCGAPTSSLTAVSAIALAERARFTLDRYRSLLAWLDEPACSFPSVYRAQNHDDRASLERLLAALSSAGVVVPHLAEGPERWAALLVTLHFVGLRKAEQIEVALVLASLAPTLAEAAAHRPASFGDYPMDVPAFVYEESR